MPLSDELMNQAKDLGLTVTDSTTEDDLKNLIDDKKKELDSKDDDKDAKYWREEAKKAFVGILKQSLINNNYDIR